MSSYLTIIGKQLDVNSLIAKCKIKPDVIWINEKTRGVKYPHSGFSLKTSKAGFNEFNLQVKDTIRFLKSSKEKLKILKLTKEIQYATLTFPVESRIEKKGIHSEFFPRELIQLAGELFLDIEITLCSIELQNSVKKNNIESITPANTNRVNPQSSPPSILKQSP
jgi:hypothetical protein